MKVSTVHINAKVGKLEFIGKTLQRNIDICVELSHTLRPSLVHVLLVVVKLICIFMSCPEKTNACFAESWSPIFIGLKHKPVGVKMYILEKLLTDKG